MSSFELNDATKPPELMGQYLTLTLGSQREIEWFENNELIPADDDWEVLTYENGSFVHQGMRGYETIVNPTYWAHLPKLKESKR